MTPQDAADRLDGCEYAREGSKELWAEMKAAGLVAVFGASDDLCEMRGAIYDEPSDWPIPLTPKGILESECREAGTDCPYFKRAAAGAATITPVWDRDGISWQYETAIPHATFKVMEDGDIYCVGIVFALADVPDPSAEAAARACYDVTVATMATALPPGLKQRTWDELEEKERVLHRDYARAARAA